MYRITKKMQHHEYLCLYSYVSSPNPFLMFFFLQAMVSDIVLLAISLLALDWMHLYILFLLIVSSYIPTSDFFLQISHKR